MSGHQTCSSESGAEERRLERRRLGRRRNMKRTKWNPRKVLIASAGVASVNYAVAAGCNDGRGLVANLVVCPAEQCGDVGGYGGASVANLVAPPPAAGSGNFFGGNGGVSGNGGFAGATVANLMTSP